MGFFEFVREATLAAMVLLACFGFMFVLHLVMYLITLFKDGAVGEIDLEGEDDERVQSDTDGH